MSWLWSIVCAALAGLLGFFLGRWFERTRITNDLLHSRDPNDWSSAHRITRGPGVARFNDEGSDHYTPTPSRPFPALREPTEAALAPTVLSKRPETPVTPGRLPAAPVGPGKPPQRPKGNPAP